MSVVSWTEVAGKNGEVDSQNYRTYTREFQVITNNPQDGPIVVSAALPLAIWSSYYATSTESDPYAKLKSLKCNQDNNELLFWRVTATYDNKPYDLNTIANGSSDLSSSPSSPSSPSPAGGQSPATRNWSISFGVRQTEAHAFQDVNGLAAVASNGQPFEGGLVIPVSIPFFSITCYSFAPNFQKPGQFVNTCNNAMFLGFNTYTLRCADYKIDTQYEDEWGYFYQKQLTFEINNDGWDLNILNAGTHTYTTPTGWTPITDAFGKDVTQPVPLSLATGLPLVPPAAPQFKTFQIYKLRNFSTIL